MPACIYLLKLERQDTQKNDSQKVKKYSKRILNYEINLKNQKVISHLRNNLTNEK